MGEILWTIEEMADLEETITGAVEAGNEELAAYWAGVRDGSVPMTSWQDVRAALSGGRVPSRRSTRLSAFAITA